MTRDQHADRIAFMNANAERFSDGEANQVRKGLCTTQTAYGMPWAEYCQEAPQDGALDCAEHSRETREQHGNNAFGLHIYPVYPDAVKIDNPAMFRAVWDALRLGDGHEPDEMNVSGIITGTDMDTATGTNGTNYVLYLRHDDPDDGVKVWAVNVAQLASWVVNG